MPNLPISDGNGEFLPIAISVLSTVMDSPEVTDPVPIAAATAVSKAASLLPPQLPIVVPAGLLGGLPAPPSGQEKHPDGGLYAHLVLYCNIVCHRHHSSLVGIQRAASLLPKSRSTVLRAWKRFSPVAHYWLAIGFRKPRPAEEGWRDYLVEFLAYAESLRREAQGIVAHGQSSPIVDPEATWKCPADISLPRVETDFGPMPEEILERLRAYRAPRASY